MLRAVIIIAAHAARKDLRRNVVVKLLSNENETTYRHRLTVSAESEKVCRPRRNAKRTKHVYARTRVLRSRNA